MKHNGIKYMNRARCINVFYLSILVAILTIRCAAVFFIPYGNKTENHIEGLNDEPSHFNYTKYLVINRSFPVLKHSVLDHDAFVLNEFEYHQAPLYYIICAPLYYVGGEQVGLLASRFLSLIFGLSSLWILMLVMRDLGCPVIIQKAAIIFAGLLPTHVYFTSVASNDSMSWFLALLFIRFLQQYVKSPLSLDTKKILIKISMCLAAGALTKSSFLFFYPVFGMVFIYRFYVSRNRSQFFIAMYAFVCSGVVALPWYIRNMFLYHSFSGVQCTLWHPSLSLARIIMLVKNTIKLFWFPMQNLQGGTAPFLIICAWGAVILAVHTVAALVFLAQKHNRTSSVNIFLLLFFVNAAAYAWYFFFSPWGNPEARFLFPALASISFFMTMPVYIFFKKLTIEIFFLPYIVAVVSFPYLFIAFAR
jgi:hypothetical protein